jgi:hypothetical protein
MQEYRIYPSTNSDGFLCTPRTVSKMLSKQRTVDRGLLAVPDSPGHAKCLSLSTSRRRRR